MMPFISLYSLSLNIFTPAHFISLSQMVTYLFVIGALESWKVQKCEV